MGGIGFQALPSQAASHVGMEMAMSLTRAGSQHKIILVVGDETVQWWLPPGGKRVKNVLCVGAEKENLGLDEVSGWLNRISLDKRRADRGREHEFFIPT
jgi:3-oxoacyl-[acyl-carrier-protein] synthase III